MFLPNKEQAEIPKNKIVGYLLSEEHATGKTKAQFFLGIGFRIQDWEILAQTLYLLVQKCEVSEVIETVFGKKYVIEGVLSAPNQKKYPIRTVWVIEKEQTIAKLVTAYPL